MFTVIRGLMCMGLLALAITGRASAAPPPLPSSFYGQVQLTDAGPLVGQHLLVYVPGVTGPVADVVIADSSGQAVYSVNVRGDSDETTVKDGGVTGDDVTFRLGTRIVAVGEWAGGSNVQLHLHAPAAALSVAPANEGSPATLDASGSTDAGGDIATYAFDCGNDGDYEVGPQAAATATCTFPDGPATHTVGVRVVDAQGGQGLATAGVTVNNVAPTGTLTVDGPVAEGTPNTVYFTNLVDPSAADLASLRFAFDCAGGDLSGAIYATSGGSTATTCTYPDEGSYPVTAKVMDKDGGASTHTVQLLVTNAAPVVTAAAGQNADEGVSKEFALGSFTDAGPNDDPWTVSVNWGDGSLATSFEALPGTLPNQPHTYADNGPYTVQVTVTDEDSGAHSASFSVTVANVAPLATFNAPAAVDEGSSIALSLTNPMDVAADTFEYAFDCGSGFGPFTTTANASCPTTDNGTRTVRGQVRDEDGGLTEYEALVTLNDVLPLAEAGGPYTGIAGEPVALLGVPTCVAVDGCTVEWLEGATLFGSDNAATRTWNTVGDYTVTLRVTDDDGNAVSDTATVSISGALHALTLQPGWNLVSFNRIPINPAPGAVLASIEGHYDLVYAWDAENSFWLKYDNVPASSDDLLTLSEKQGFWVHVTAAHSVVLSVAGSVPTETSFTLTAGWNLVGYPAAGNTALASTTFARVYAYRANSPADPWKVYDSAAPAWSNDLTHLEPGWGYWIYVTSNTSWTVPYL